MTTIWRLCSATLALAACAATSQAAGFDCAKAGTPVEKTVCQDAGLTALDERLAAEYRDALQRCPAGTLRDDQQRWLSEVRDACPNASCLTQAYQARLAELQTPRCPAATCTGVAQRLIGAWRLASGAGPFEEIAFAPGQKPSQGRFDTWLHQRPEFADGRWRLQACELRLILPGEPDAGTSRLTVKSANADALEVLEAGAGRPARYRRIRR